MRTATIKRKTKETDIEVAVNLDGFALSKVSTGIGFFDHMLDSWPGIPASTSWSRPMAISLCRLSPYHQGCWNLALGQAVKQALGTMAGITRYASYRRWTRRCRAW